MINQATLSIGALLITYILGLLAWGYEDKKTYHVHIISFAIFSFFVFVLYAITLYLNFQLYTIFFIAGIVIMFLTYLALRRQITTIDHAILFMGNVIFPLVAIPAFLLSMAITIFRREQSHAYIWVYAVSFVVITVIESVLLIAKIFGIF